MLLFRVGFRKQHSKRMSIDSDFPETIIDYAKVSKVFNKYLFLIHIIGIASFIISLFFNSVLISFALYILLVPDTDDMIDYKNKIQTYLGFRRLLRLQGL